MNWNVIRHIVEVEIREEAQTSAILGSKALISIFVVTFFAKEILLSEAGSGNPPYVMLLSISNTFMLLIPIVAAIITYESIVREKQSGTLRLALSVPYSRSDVLAGKLIAKYGLTLAAFAIPLIIIIAGILYFEALFLKISLFVIFTLWLIFIFVSVSLTVSVYTTTTRQALASCLGIVIANLFIWPLAVSAVSLLYGFNKIILDCLLMFSATESYISLLSTIIDPSKSGSILVTGFALVSLCMWTIFPTILSIRVLNRIDV